jgi:hypothetical protein
MAPVAMVVLPLAIWTPVDFLTEYLSTLLASGVEEVRTYQRIANFMEFFVGTYVLGIVLAATRRIAKGEDVGAGACAAEAGRNYGRLLSTTFSAGWRIGLGALLFLIPGCVLTARYALAVPMTAWSDSPSYEGLAGLEESEDLVKGHATRIFFSGAWAYMAWTFTLLLPTFGLAYAEIYTDASWTTNTYLATILGIPIHLAAIGVMVGATLIYRDLVALRQGGVGDDLAPIGQHRWDPMVEAKPEEASGLRAVLIVSALGTLGLGAAVKLAIDVAQSLPG